MKKTKLLLIGLAAAMALPLSAATITVERIKPAEVDLGTGKTISMNIIPATTKSAKKYQNEQLQLGEIFINSLTEYAEVDGRFKLTKETPTADIQINIAWSDFSVTDDGISLSQTLDDGTENVIKDEWTRSCSGRLDVNVIDRKTGTVMATKNFWLFNANDQKYPKADLPSPVELLTKQATNNPYQIACVIFDSKYWQPVTILDMKTKDKTIKEQMKNALKMLKKADYEGALAIYEEIYTATSDVSVGYDYARTLQCLKRFDEAEALIKSFQEADQKNKTYKKALEDIALDRSEYGIISSR